MHVAPGAVGQTTKSTMIKYVSISGYLVFSNMTHNVIMDGQIFGRVLAIEITNKSSYFRVKLKRIKFGL